MKHIRPFLLGVSLCCTPLAQAGVQDAPATPELRTPGWQPPPATVDGWADRCSDFTVNSWSFKDPKNFALWLNTFTDPAIYLEFGGRMEDPHNWSKMMGTLLDPGVAKNYLEWTDPVIYSKWAGAAVNPSFYFSIMTPFLDPGKYMRWMMAPMNPRSWNVAMNMMNPALWTKWMAAPFDQQNYAPLAKAGDPNNLAGWSQVLNDAKTYPGFSAFVPQATGQPTPSNGAFNLFNPANYFEPYASPAPVKPESAAQGENGSRGEARP